MLSTKPEKKMSEAKEKYVSYDFAGELGRGGFGVVYLIDNNTGPKLAFKTVHIPSLSDKLRQRATEEAKLLHRLDHKHLVHFLTAYIHKSYLCIVTEYCEGGDMGEFLTRLEFFPHCNRVPEKLVICWLMQTCSALNYMHTSEPLVLHRDIKPQNIYITEKGDIRLGDFGLAKKLQGPKYMAYSMAGTMGYLSPEILKRRPYNSKADIYSLGCVFYEITGGQQVEKSGPVLLLQIIRGHKVKMSEGYSKELLKIITLMLSKRFEKRPSAGKILDSKIIKDFLKKPQEPLDIIHKHARSTNRTILKLRKEISPIKENIPFTEDDIRVPQDSLKALQRAVKDHDGHMDQLDGRIPAIDEPLSVGETVCDGGGETDNDVTEDELGGETFFDSEQTPEFDEKDLVLKIEHLQSKCTCGLGQEKLDQVLEVIHNTQDMNSLRGLLEATLGEFYAEYGTSVVELCLLKCSLDNKDDEDEDDE